VTHLLLHGEERAEPATAGRRTMQQTVVKSSPAQSVSGQGTVRCAHGPPEA